MRFLNLLLTLFMGIAASVAPPTSDPVPADAIENGAQGYPIAGYIYGRSTLPPIRPHPKSSTLN